MGRAAGARRNVGTPTSAPTAVSLTAVGPSLAARSRHTAWPCRRLHRRCARRPRAGSGRSTRPRSAIGCSSVGPRASVPLQMPPAQSRRRRARRSSHMERPACQTCHMPSSAPATRSGGSGGSRAHKSVPQHRRLLPVPLAAARQCAITTTTPRVRACARRQSDMEFIWIYGSLRGRTGPVQSGAGFVSRVRHPGMVTRSPQHNQWPVGEPLQTVISRAV